MISPERSVTRTHINHPRTKQQPPIGDDSMKDGLIISILSILPKKPIARFMGFSARLRLPNFAQRLLIRYFVWRYKINIEECEGDLQDFSSLSEFFIRELKDGRRVIEQEPNSVVSPVDGRVHTFGRIENGRFTQYDQQSGSVAEMLGLPESESLVRRFQQGEFVIIYLSPQDYHRVHSHDDGNIQSLSYFPGKLWPVFPAATRSIPHLFDRNERLVFEIHHPLRNSISTIALIGAFGVGRMTTDWDPVITNNKEPQKSVEIDSTIQRGIELGRFELGSTVVLFFEPGQIKEWLITEKQSVRLGEKIAFCSMIE